MGVLPVYKPLEISSSNTRYGRGRIVPYFLERGLILFRLPISSLPSLVDAPNTRLNISRR